MCNSSHSRPKTIAGPMRAVRMEGVLPWRCAARTITAWANWCPTGAGRRVGRFLELIQTPHGGDDALFAAALFPAVFDDLQIDVVPGAFLSEEHGGLPAVFSIATMTITLFLRHSP